MNLSDDQKRIIQQVVNCYETGSPEGDYGAVTILKDGPNQQKQITYGRSQTTEYSNLDDLIERYSAEPDSLYGEAFRRYVDDIGHRSLVRDSQFITLLKSAGTDPIMVRVQDEFFDERFFQPAKKWAEQRGFEKALSLLVIYDSFIHSGSIPHYLRKRFAEVPPHKGGNEEAWTAAYVKARHNWLANHSIKILRRTIYRTRDFQREIEKGNWDLSDVPILAHGIRVE